MKRVIFFVVMCWMQPLWAWSETGHLIMAQIAYNCLDPSAKFRVNTLVRQFDAFGDTYTSDFITASTWMDRLKRRGFNLFNSFHYISHPLCDRHNTTLLREPPALNAVSVLEDVVRTLKSRQAGDFEKAMALRMFLHVAADIHNPLHTVSFFSYEFPEGDRGGTRLTFEPPLEVEEESIPNLHVLWDKGFGAYPAINIESETPWRHFVKSVAKSMKKQVGVAEVASITSKPLERWQDDAYEVAITFAYPEILSKGRPSQAYLTEGAEHCQKLYLKGGLRMGHLLNEIFGDE